MTARQLIEAPQDYVVLAGQRSPGIAHVEGAELTRLLRERRPFGYAAATIIDQGASLIPFHVRLLLLDADALDAWDTWKRLLVRSAQRQTIGQTIEHPILADLEITSCIYEGRTQLTIGETGGFEVTIRFREYRRPQPALAAPDSTTDAPPTDPLEREIARQQATIDALTDPQRFAPTVT